MACVTRMGCTRTSHWQAPAVVGTVVGMHRPIEAVRSASIGAVLLVSVLVGCAAPDPVTNPQQPLSPTTQPPVEPPAYDRVPGVATHADLDGTDDPLGTWLSTTAVREIGTTSTIDGAEQRALFAPPAAAGGPLLVVVHSWSDGYTQALNTPLAHWAQQVGWGYLQPDFRGRNDDPAATGSDLAVQDVVDAVDYAVATAGVDPGRVYVFGFSGGGMMSLLLAGRRADRFAGAVSWVPVHDLAAWYAYNRDEQPQRHYAGDILASCGGDPTVPGPAAESCAARSPAGVLPVAAGAGVPVYLGAGIDDDVVPASDAVLAFNALAAPQDRLGADVVAAARAGELAPGLEGRVTTDTWFTDADPRVLHARRSAAVTLVLFDGGHELVYYPGLDWLAGLDATARASSGTPGGPP